MPTAGDQPTSASGPSTMANRSGGSAPRGSDLKTRIATASILVPVVLAGMYLDPTPISVAIIVCSAAVIAADEYARMVLGAFAGGVGRGQRLAFALAVFTVVVACLIWGPTVAMAPSLSVVALLLAVSILARPGHLPHAVVRFSTLLSGLIYVPVLMCVWPLIKRDFGTHWLTVTLCAAFFSDTVAYFVGRAMGRRPLLPTVSPKKTREGAIGGLLGGIAATVGLGSAWLLPELPVSHALGLGLVASAAGQVGDLVESMLKRGCGVKDSGTILPGHGGVLDRVDALLFVAPVIYYYCAFSGS